MVTVLSEASRCARAFDVQPYPIGLGVDAASELYERVNCRPRPRPGMDRSVKFSEKLPSRASTGSAAFWACSGPRAAHGAHVFPLAPKVKAGRIVPPRGLVMNLVAKASEYPFTVL